MPSVLACAIVKGIYKLINATMLHCMAIGTGMWALVKIRPSADGSVQSVLAIMLKLTCQGL